MVWTCYTSNRTCKHHRAGHSTRREETRQTKEMLARQHQGMDGAASCQDPETSRRQKLLEEDHQNICGAPAAPQRLRAVDDEYDDDAEVVRLMCNSCVNVEACQIVPEDPPWPPGEEQLLPAGFPDALIQSLRSPQRGARKSHSSGNICLYTCCAHTEV